MTKEEKKARVAKPFLAVKRVENAEPITVTLKKDSMESLDAYAKFQGCTRDELIDALIEVAVKKDKVFRQSLQPKAE